jgi:glycerophosphoryl diester phosphodiesterase
MKLKPKCAYAAAVLITAIASTSLGIGAKAAALRTDVIRQKLFDANGGVFVVAHRGCHNPVPARAMPAVPENSLAALEKCVALGVDMMETDIRRAKDGTLVISHDAKVDRTTDGTGRVADLTLAQLKTLRLRQNFGGNMSPEITDQRVLTLDELLAAAKGRIMINLDIKEDIYPEVIAAAVRAGMADQVLVKSVVKAPQSPLADQPPYTNTPYMPIVWRTAADAYDDLPAVVQRQLAAAHRVPAVEMVYLDDGQFEEVRTAAQMTHVRLWANTLTSVGVLSVLGMGGDQDALRDHGATWGRLIDAGVSAIQTDEPEPLMAYLKTRPSDPNGRHEPAPHRVKQQNARPQGPGVCNKQ